MRAVGQVFPNLSSDSADDMEVVPPLKSKAETELVPPWRARLCAGGDGLAGTPRSASRRVGAWRRTGVPLPGCARGRTTEVIQLRKGHSP